MNNMKRLICASNLEDELNQLENNILKELEQEQNEIYDLMEEILDELEDDTVTASKDTDDL